MYDTSTFHIAMRFDEPNATREAVEISAAWECLLVDADMYATLTVVAAMKIGVAVAIYSTEICLLVTDYIYGSSRCRRRRGSYSSHRCPPSS